MTPPSSDVVVLGGGPAGLAAAWWAARTGRSVTLLERAPEVGGLGGSFDVAGLRVDHGSHRLHPATAPHVMAEMESLLGDDLQRRTRNGRLRLAQRWFNFPPSPSQLLRHAPPAFAASLARDLVTTAIRKPREDTYAEVVRTGVGPTLGEHLYYPFAHKLWGTAAEDLDGEQARKRIKATSPAAIARKAISRTSTKHFFYPRRGFGQIVDALAQAAVGAGASIVTGATVTSVDGATGAVTTARGDSYDGAVVLSTIPLTVLARCLAAPADVASAAARQRSRAMDLVYLVLDRPRWTAFDAHYIPELSVLPHRVSEPKNYRDSHDDPSGVTVLCAEIPCWPDDAVDHDTLVVRVVDDLARLGLPSAEPVDSVVRRVQSVYPVYDRSFAPALATVEDFVTSLPRVVTLGRQGLFAHDNTHHTLEMAKAAVDALGRDGMDRARWAADRERFRAHVVED